MAVNAETCQKIICGIISQADAGMDVVYECAAAGYQGALYPCHESCKQFGLCAQLHPVALPPPLQGPTVQMLQELTATPPPAPLSIDAVIQPVPDVVALAVPLVQPQINDCGCVNVWINENPLLALGLLALAFVVVSKGK